MAILKEYMRIRSGGGDDFLFPTENGEQLKEHGFRSSVARYNNRRGIQKTSIHAFRHTFARKYLVDCGGKKERQEIRTSRAHLSRQLEKGVCGVERRKNHRKG